MDKISNIPTEIIHKEIDLIQSCISRMAHNSFLLKGWLISLISVVLAIVPKQKSNIIILVIIVFLITISFWYLDAFFLRAEKEYRKLYEWVLKERALNNTYKLYDLNCKRFENDVDNIFKIMVSKTLIWFYIIPLISSTILLLYYYIII